MNLDELRSRVNTWFERDSLAELLTPVESQTEELALAWMAKVGKRWRPFLAACAYRALAADQSEAFAPAVRNAAVAVECFHKASLIHDDIEDGDDERYGDKTLHAEYGVPIALNVGDLLLGEGYRLLAEAETSDACRARMLAAAARGHRNLCLGQGNELSWIRWPRPLAVREVIDIFAKKTSPAFEVALKLGAILCGQGDDLNEVLEQYSGSLGIAYQIRDDIEDFRSSDGPAALNARRPSLMLALAYQHAGGDDSKLLESIWSGANRPASMAEDVARLLAGLEVGRLAFDLMESYKSRAILK